MPINKAELLQKLLGYGEEHVGDLTKYFKNPENVEVVNDLVRKKAPKVLQDIEGEVVENSPRLITQAEQSATPIVEDIAESVTPKASKATMMDAISGLTPNQKTIGGAGLIAAASAPLFMDSTSDTELPKLAEPVSKPSVQKELPPQQEVKKSQTTGKKSVVDNALTESSPEITQLNAQQHSPIDDYNQKLLDARQQDNEHNLLFGMLKAAQMGGSALAGSKSDTSFADAELAKNNEMTNQLKTNEEMKQEKKKFSDQDMLRDPNSSASQQARDIARKVGLKVTDQTTAKELSDAGLPIGTLLTQKMAIDSRKEDAQFKREMLAATKSDKKELQDEKQNLEVQKTVDRLVNNLRTSDDFKTYQSTKSAQAALDAAITSGNKTDTGSAFMLYAKIAQGDNSVVRESDMKNLAGSYNYKSPSEMFSKLSAKAAGGNFNTEELTQMKKIATLIQGIKAKHVKEQLEPITTRIQKNKLDPNESISPEIVREFSQDFDVKKPEKTTISNKVPSGMVKIMGPDGKTHYIPSENVDKAIARGAKVVQ